MRIISRTPLVAFCRKYPDAAIAVEVWYKIVKRVRWNSFDDIKQYFNSVDYVGNNHYVFNLKGNNYRLVVVIIMTPLQRVYVRFIGTHDEYNKIDCKTI
ncbi:hypothetical protein FACS189456_3800 [Bacteroidia bacterium]|nr:hypothetical protein FACS189456_3800 [Bacteroidia bacterium]